MAERTENDAVIATAQQAVTPTDIGNGLHVFLTAQGEVRIVDAEEQVQYREGGPRRKTGARSVADPESLVEYLRRHATDETEVWADLEARRVVAYVDGHANDSAGYHEHTVSLDVHQTPEWREWNQISGDLISQTQFAEFLEQRAEDVVPRTDEEGTPLPEDPTALSLIRLAQTVTGQRNVQFKSGVRIETGDVQVEWVEDTQVNPGHGTTTIPSKIFLGLRPFVGGKKFQVEAALRWRVSKDESVTLGWVLVNPVGILEAAFEAYIDSIREGLDSISEPSDENLDACDIPLFLGKVTKIR